MTTQTSKTQRPGPAATDSGFRAIPTRIRSVPPLIVEQQGEQVREALVERLRAVEQGLAKTHRAAAEAYLSQGMYGAALTHLEAAATFSPDQLEYHNQLGFVRYVEGDDIGALTSFERVLESQPDHADALFNMGMVLFGQGDATRAEECFRRSLQGNANDAETWNNRGVCLHGLGQAEQARACFQRALQLEPGNEDARANLAAL
jgi:Flp pilus assembly protein TadD